MLSASHKEALRKVTEQAKIQRALHYMAAQHFRTWQRWLGRPSKALSGTVAGGIFGVIYNQVSCEVNIPLWIALGILQMGALALQIGLDEADNKAAAVKHEAASKKYGSFARKYETALLIGISNSPLSPIEYVSKAQNKISRICDDADTPSIPDSILQKYHNNQIDQRVGAPDVGNLISPVLVPSSSSDNIADTDLQKEFRAAMSAEETV